jgi:hypothetical protein
MRKSASSFGFTVGIRVLPLSDSWASPEMRVCVNEREALPAYARQLLNHLIAAKHEIALPPKIQWAQAKGFSLYMLRAVLNGRADEVV